MSTWLRCLIGFPVAALGLCVMGFSRYVLAKADLDWTATVGLVVIRLVGAAILVTGVAIIGHVKWPLWANWLVIAITSSVTIACYLYMRYLVNLDPEATTHTNPQLGRRVFATGMFMLISGVSTIAVLMLTLSQTLHW
jgi:hypothetical protein